MRLNWLYIMAITVGDMAITVGVIFVTIYVVTVDVLVPLFSSANIFLLRCNFSISVLSRNRRHNININVMQK